MYRRWARASIRMRYPPILPDGFLVFNGCAEMSRWSSRWALASMQLCCCAKSWTNRSAPLQHPAVSTLFFRTQIRLKTGHKLIGDETRASVSADS